MRRSLGESLHSGRGYCTASFDWTRASDSQGRARHLPVCAPSLLERLSRFPRPGRESPWSSQIQPGATRETNHFTLGAVAFGGWHTPVPVPKRDFVRVSQPLASIVPLIFHTPTCLQVPGLVLRAGVGLAAAAACATATATPVASHTCSLHCSLRQR